MSFLEDNIERIDSDSTDDNVFWSEFNKVTELLDYDLTEIKKILDSNDTQLWRRVYYRTFFSYLDGFVYSLGQMFLFFDWFVVDDETEIKIRNKRIIKKKDNSKILADRFIPINKRLKLVFDSIAKAADTDPIIPSSSSFWTELSITSDVRNRIVHPKKSEDLFISDNEIELIHKVGMAFMLATSELLKKRAEAYLDMYDAMLESAKKTFNQKD
ncbi:MAG: hypothetical protein BA863_07580 [Desulfovibrio sp. S3730MH75]|nr:MAG: hypothetical protein BA863_07580 [Desulfovibrio sp. S3730MH75]